MSVTNVLERANNVAVINPVDAGRSTNYPFGKLTDQRGLMQGFSGPPLPLTDDERPEFPLAAFPPGSEPLRDMCLEVAEKCQVPLDLPALLALTIGGAALSRKFMVDLGGTWKEPTNLYTGLVMEPANRKSVVFRIMAEPVREFERQLVQNLIGDRADPLLTDYATVNGSVYITKPLSKRHIEEDVFCL